MCVCVLGENGVFLFALAAASRWETCPRLLEPDAGVGGGTPAFAPVAGGEQGGGGGAGEEEEGAVPRVRR